MVTVVDFDLSNYGVCNFLHFSLSVREPVGKSHIATWLNITTILLIMRFELPNQMLGGSEFTSLNVCFSILCEEQIFVLSEGFNPFSELGGLY